MTEEDNALVERLRDQADRWYGSIGSMHSVEWEAADRIEALEEALAQQVEACFCLDCEMCFRHEQLLKEQGK